MKVSVYIHLLLHLLLCTCCIHCTDVLIQSNPAADGSIIKTEVDQMVSLSCMVEGLADDGELEWYRNKQLVSVTDENRMEESHLCVAPVTTEDNGAIFTCQLKTNASLTASIQLEVSYPPDLNGSEEIHVEEESDAVLSCNVQASPPVAVIWKKDDAVLDLSSSTYHTSNDGVTAQLSIYNIKRSAHQGQYSCEATSPTYGLKSKTFILIVGDKVMKFPLWPTIAGIVVVLLTILLAVISRWQRVMKCFKRIHH